MTERFYFMYSFTFLLLRTTAVAIYAASINEASKEPTKLLLSALPEVYNVEVIYKLLAYRHYQYYLINFLD